MKPSDYRCDYCSKIFEFWVKNKEDFPKFTPCPRCNMQAKRIYSSFGTICHQGKVGNYKNGYTSTGGNIKKS